MRYACGDLYEGEWLSDLRHGKGVMFWAETKEMYTGDWVRGLQEGQGTMNYRNGEVYTGGWLAGQRHGLGVLTPEGGGEETDSDGEGSRTASSGVGGGGGEAGKKKKKLSRRSASMRLIDGEVMEPEQPMRLATDEGRASALGDAPPCAGQRGDCWCATCGEMQRMGLACLLTAWKRGLCLRSGGLRWLLAFVRSRKKGPQMPGAGGRGEDERCDG
jgi:hypothetical protein